ncbi:MAG: HNH endonuclease [Pseudobdellovibrionaceae bacterium]
MPRQEAPRQRTSSVSQETRRAVFNRDKGECQFLSRDGIKCRSTYRIELDHIIPRSQGGPDSVANLRCVCRAHNQWKADGPQERVISTRDD